MAQSQVIAAEFPQMRYATAAIDWFRNQGIDPDAIGAFAVPPGGQPRPPRPGDNQRDDLVWIVSLDLARAKFTRRVAVDAMKREGGKLLARAPSA
jgi:hypothetical protein